MATPSKNNDRRAERTRLMLRQAFLDVVRDKGLTKASVQDIVDRANVSRGTFYAHYADKYALIETIVREEFQHSLNSLPPAGEWTSETFELLVQTVLEYFKTVYLRHHRSRDISPVIDKAIHEELNTLIFTWLKGDKQRDRHAHISLETIAQIIGWAIFGAAVQWIKEANGLSSAQMAHETVEMLLKGVVNLLSDPLAE